MADGGEPESKGSGFGSAVATLKQALTPEQLEQLMAMLPEETAELVRHPPLPVAWISSKHFQAIVSLVAEKIWPGDEAKIEDWGRRAMLADLKTIYKMFIRFMSPQFVIDRGTKLWDTYSRNQGTAKAVATGDKECEVFYLGLPASIVGPGFWAYQRGVLRGVMEATGLKNIQVTLQSGAGNSTSAQYRVSWG